ncbi:MAG: hypothetical protein KH126_01420 [Azospirillum sp.]|nr:hypothetical protein [Azospirillum sp.]
MKYERKSKEGFIEGIRSSYAERICQGSGRNGNCRNKRSGCRFERRVRDCAGKVGNKGSSRKRFHNEKPETGFKKATKPGLFCAEENGQGVFETEKEVLKLSEKLPRMGKSGQFFLF